MISVPSTQQLIANLQDARARTLELLKGLSDEQLVGPKLETVNPMIWEIGHLNYFNEFWILRHLDKCEPLIANADELYDSIAIAHETRWDLSVPSLEVTLEYLQNTIDAITRRLASREANNDDRYFYQLATYHEDMHTEAFTYTRQTLAYPTPEFALAQAADSSGWDAGSLPGDVEISGGSFMLGAMPDDGFVFDNEKWAHPVEIKPFCIARAPVTNTEYAEFVDDKGYQRKELWSEAGWQWRSQQQLEHPVYWLRRHDNNNDWHSRQFDEILPLRPHAPIIHVSWYEAQAYCRWANRRLPNEAEWELAASAEPDENGQSFGATKRRFPWGDAPPTPQHANLDGRALGCIDVAALPAGDSAFGCRQMTGNVWEWTATEFGPYPGFVPDPYKEYSQTSFFTRKVLRGGCWATRGRMLRNTWRNYFQPYRNDVFAGFRTCAL